MIPSIEHEVLIEAPVDVVWRAVTEPDQISSWFTDTAEIDVRPGGTGTLTWSDRATKQLDAPITAHIRVETVDEPHTFAFRWMHPDGAPARAGNSVLVEFTLTADGGNTRLRVTETGLADLGWPEADAATYA